MPTSSGKLPRVEPVAEYLADREGLQGRSRTIFLRLLQDGFGFRASASGKMAVPLACWTLGIGGLGLAIETQTGLDARAALSWLAIGGVGVALAIVTDLRRDPAHPANRELEWLAYCALVRPQILRSQPGMLDRNLAAARPPAASARSSHRPDLASLLGASGNGARKAAAVGWTAGSLAAIAWRIAADQQTWLWVAPLAGLALGSLIRVALRVVVFRRLARAGGE